MPGLLGRNLTANPDYLKCLFWNYFRGLPDLNQHQQLIIYVVWDCCGQVQSQLQRCVLPDILEVRTCSPSSASRSTYDSIRSTNRTADVISVAQSKGPDFPSELPEHITLFYSSHIEGGVLKNNTPEYIRANYHSTQRPCGGKSGRSKLDSRVCFAQVPVSFAIILPALVVVASQLLHYLGLDFCCLVHKIMIHDSPHELDEPPGIQVDHVAS